MESSVKKKVVAKSKIPRYKYSQIPVCSLDYKKIHKEVKVKRQEIESKSRELENLTSELKSLNLSTEHVDAEEEFKTTTTSTTRSCIRSNVITPGGTKRKVNTARLQFKMHLKMVLGRLIEKNPACEVIAEELLERVQQEIPFGNSENKKVLGLVSEIYGVRLKHRGKKKQAYYPGLSLVCQFQSETSNDNPAICRETSQTETREVTIDTNKSPRVKIARGEELSSSKTSCRGRLHFADSNVPEENLAMDMEDTQVKECTLSIGQLYEAWCSTHETAERLSSNVKLLTEEKMELHSKIVHLEEKISKMEELSGALVNKQCEVMKLYKEITEAGCLLGGMLTLSERNAIKDEVKKAKQLTNFGFRKEDIDLVELFDPNLFNQLLHNMKRDCPTILNILEQLVLSPNASRNIKKTVSLKMKAAVHLLGSLLDVRDQNSGNDIPVLFGLLCLCYGAGPSMIEVLQSLGLSESFTTLTSLLKRQLQRYREIIAKRVPDNIPVITYQDNMQLMRTSMRHLRLSKLHKEKQKQNKMWDFTVRGWRKADISGIENLFKHKETAVDPQKDIRSLEYSEIKIESNQEHLELWNAFKEKKTLQKLDKVLNHIKSTSEELIHATSEELEKMAKQAEESKSHVKNFKIEIPDVYEEFPSLGKKQSKIYPLPISHENQCTILGVASNLDLFASEFGFKARRTDERPYLPLKRSGKDYDLDKAYQRYAFLKSYEKHQEKQKEYDSILRGQERVLEETEMHETEIEETIIFHDDDCSSSDDDRED